MKNLIFILAFIATSCQTKEVQFEGKESPNCYLFFIRYDIYESSGFKRMMDENRALIILSADLKLSVTMEDSSQFLLSKKVNHVSDSLKQHFELLKNHPNVIISNSDESGYFKVIARPGKYFLCYDDYGKYIMKIIVIKNPGIRQTADPGSNN